MNIGRLKQEMKRKNISLNALSDVLDMEQSCLQKKLDGLSEFTLFEICLIADVLCLDKRMIMLIFFE